MSFGGAPIYGEVLLLRLGGAVSLATPARPDAARAEETAEPGRPPPLRPHRAGSGPPGTGGPEIKGRYEALIIVLPQQHVGLC